MKRVAIFASGSGSNAENIHDFFKDNTEVEISLVLTNNPNAFVLERAKKLKIPSLVFNREQFTQTDYVVDALHRNEIDFVVLAGFLWLIPQNLIEAFPQAMVNVHPALLPKFGGKGMYGDNVHKAVVAQREKETGITIHYVNQNYDEGAIIFQAKTLVESTDTPEQVAAKVHQLEYKYFPKVIGELLS